ncbi:acetylcholinesterase-1-like [Ixodes scapularis]|uniref:acetylcholinesterase-1-like n=1 Tax=Ixodes scapularis TaxID=6945 RepID=UPI001C382543|nr:acetylcholinesterase-1-like [Ixodes scapularis]
MSEATSLPHEMASLTSSPRTSAASLPEGRAQTFNLRADSSCQSLEYDYSQTFKKTTTNRNGERNNGTLRLVIVVVSMMLVSLLLALLLRHPPRKRSVVVATKFGLVRAFQVPVEGSRRVMQYMGIPYAQSTAHENRFAMPKDVPPLTVPSADQTIKAVEEWDQPSRPCPQASSHLPQWLQVATTNGSEDCLRLNIWTPDSQCLRQGPLCGNRTVVVFIHGGDFLYGSNAGYDGTLMSSRGDLVVAVPNYRLGILGFVNGRSPENPGNLGLYDQLSALRWLRANVGYFGGDAKRMVLVGHDSGATSIGYLLLSRRKELVDISRFVFLSGNPFTRYTRSSDDTRTVILSAAKQSQCAPKDPNWPSHGDNASVEELLSCLRHVDLNQLEPCIQSSIGWGPNLNDKTLFPNSRLALLGNQSSLAGKRFLIGTYADDAYSVTNNITQYETKSVIKTQSSRRKDGTTLIQVEKRLQNHTFTAEHLANAGSDVYVYFLARSLVHPTKSTSSGKDYADVGMLMSRNVGAKWSSSGFVALPSFLDTVVLFAKTG